MTKKNEKIMESYQKTKEMQVKKRYVRYAEGAEMYSMCEAKFQQLAKDANAVYKINQLCLVNLDILEEYLQTFRVPVDFYK